MAALRSFWAAQGRGVAVLAGGLAIVAVAGALTATPAAAVVGHPPAPEGGGACDAGGWSWVGTFSGTREDPMNDWRRPVFLRACFPNEYTCRRWVNSVQTWAEAPGLMRCERLGR
ncbi:hypothetical protein [Afifella aestuarii]|uniref:hypothetical protein n=1 Tax=Afifella aestuarii TaxID=1909496 RepID=UPI000FE40F78|nr:hypothetical protein [Afifella aestuarii]